MQWLCLVCVWPSCFPRSTQTKGGCKRCKHRTHMPSVRLIVLTVVFFSHFHLQISVYSLLNEMALLFSQYWNNTHNIKKLKLVSKQGIWRCSALKNSWGDVPGIANISLWQHAAVRGESAATRRHEVCWDVPRAPWCSGGRLAEGQTHSFAPRCGGTSPDFCGAQVSFAYLCACHGYLCAAAERNGCVWSQYNLSIQ